MIFAHARNAGLRRRAGFRTTVTAREPTSSSTAFRRDSAAARTTAVPWPFAVAGSAGLCRGSAVAGSAGLCRGSAVAGSAGLCRGSAVAGSASASASN